MLHVIKLLPVVAMVFAAGCSGEKEQGGPPKPATFDYESGEVGKLPAGFVTDLTGGGGAVAWVVREDPSAPSGKKTLVQESADDTSYRFPLCIYQDAVAKDVAVEVKYKAISGVVDQAGGIVLRYTPENYYVARANALEDNINLFKTQDGKRVKIEEVTAKVTPGEWHTFRFEAKGKHLKVIFDGQTVIEKDDETFTGPGKVGLWTKADSVSAFDDFKIEPVK
ncbi:family 16 glycoside hydrolase [Singulisphaera sp. PoT]|uniref:family 16 glycoside hydrolase n=1 Tax=Singulisphaera sp. PoT TaxID=3411797 RepID=UPI003BF5A5F5